MATMIVAAEVLSGLFCGYLTISVCESFFHRTIQHASPALRLLYGKWGWAGESLTHAWYSHHVVHHFLTFRKNHVTQFSNEEEQARLDLHLTARRFGYITECRYGLILGDRLKYYAWYMAPTVPIFILLCCIGGSWFTIGACLPLCLWPMLAQFIHRYLHMRYRDVIDRGPFVIRVLAKTAYFRYLARHHWLHHRYTNCNYNLLLGGDYVLGVWWNANNEDLDEIRSIGLW
jgi:hypothetical protein